MLHLYTFPSGGGPGLQRLLVPLPADALLLPGKAQQACPSALGLVHEFELIFSFAVALVGVSFVVWCVSLDVLIFWSKGE